MAELTPQQQQAADDAAGIKRAEDGSYTQYFDDGSTLVSTADGSFSSTEATDRIKPNPDANATSAPTSINWSSVERDLRVRLEVPKEYLTGLGGGPSPGGLRDRPLARTRGIVFPYTPSVSVSNQANYSAVSPTHSNYASYAYKNSTVGPIQISGKFTAQNEYEASVILGVQHLLRALIKMKWGDDKNAGAPPPVCRLFAYGNSMIDNVPVVVQSWKMEYPDSVDYIQVGQGIKDYGNSFVPTICTISIDLAIQYSRKEQLDYSVDGFLAGKFKNKGYL